MTYRVVQWSTGNVGRLALHGIVQHPDLELAGVLVHSPDKAGKDAGELADLPPIGVTATSDPDEILALGADCVSYTATGDLRPDDAVADMARILEAGTNVVATSVVPLVYPPSAPRRYTEPLESACKAGDVSCFTSGIDPGFANDLIPFAFLGACERVDSVRVMEILDYSTYLQADVLFDIMGFGKSLDELPLILQPGVIGLAWGCTVSVLAAGLGVDLEDIRGHALRGAGNRGRGASDRARARHAHQRGGCARLAVAPGSGRVSRRHRRQPRAPLPVPLRGRGRRPQHRRPGGDGHAVPQRDSRRLRVRPRFAVGAGPAAPDRPRPDASVTRNSSGRDASRSTAARRDHAVVDADDLRRVVGVGGPVAVPHHLPDRRPALGEERVEVSRRCRRVRPVPVRRRRVGQIGRARAAVGVVTQVLDLSAHAVARGRELRLARAAVARAEAREVVVAASGGEPARLDVRLRKRHVAAYVLGRTLLDVDLHELVDRDPTR